MSDHEKCGAEKDSGERCQSDIGLCDCHGQCFFHAPCREEERAEAVSRGGQATAAKTRKAVPLDLPLETLEDAKAWLHRAALLVVNGEIKAQQCFAICRAISTWLDADAAQVEREDLAELREQIEELRELRAV